MKSFVDRFNKNDSNKPESEADIVSFEQEYGITLPLDYKEFLKVYGDIWTPDILDLMDDKELDFPDVQEFWKLHQIKKDKNNGWTSQLDTNLIPFASDCMGNIFGFKMNELKGAVDATNIYFYDHDFESIELVSESFTKWIEEYLKINE